jgi:YfiH family protein
MKSCVNSDEGATAIWPADWLVPQWPAPKRVRAVCTTRAGGASVPPFESLNLGTHVGDDPEQVNRNRACLQGALRAKPVCMDQVHGTHVLELDALTPDNLAADGSFTRQSGLACTVMVADCLPILLCDTLGTQVAAVHAGWRGLAGAPGHGAGSGVVEEIFKCFMPLAPVEYAQAAPKIIAWLGPCIGPQAFEVGDEVREAFVIPAPQAADCFLPVAPGKWRANLSALARQRLLAAGVSAVYGNDGSPPWCTVANPSRFFSYRRDRVTGRQAACIWLE